MVKAAPHSVSGDRRQANPSGARGLIHTLPPAPFVQTGPTTASVLPRPRPAKNGVPGNDFPGQIRSPEDRDGATEGFVLDTWDKFVFCIFKPNPSSVHSMEEEPSSIQHIKPESPG
jgi:hypothetical protein